MAVWYEKNRVFSTNISLWDDRWNVECCQQISTVEYVDNTKRRTPFIAAGGHAKTHRISESSHDWCNVVNKLLWWKYVDNSKRLLRIYHLTVAPKRAEQILFVLMGGQGKVGTEKTGDEEKEGEGKGKEEKGRGGA